MDNRNNQVLFSPTQKAPPAVADLSSFYQTYQNKVVDTNASSGDNILSLSGTPSGIVRIVTAIGVYDTITAIDQITIMAIINGVNTRIVRKLSPAINEFAEFSGQVILDENEYINTRLVGCTAGDTIAITALGYDVKKY